MTQVVAVMGDESTINGILLAGAGIKDAEGKSNFAVIDQDTPKSEILAKFKELTARNDVQVLFVNYFVAGKIRDAIDAIKGQRPVVMEIPGATETYDIEQDPVMKHLK